MHIEMCNPDPSKTPDGYFTPAPKGLSELLIEQAITGYAARFLCGATANQIANYITTSRIGVKATASTVKPVAEEMVEKGILEKNGRRYSNRRC